MSEQYPDVRKWPIQSGEFFTDADVRTAARVIVFKDGRIKKDYQIDEPRDAAEALRNLPPVELDEDEEE